MSGTCSTDVVSQDQRLRSEADQYPRRDQQQWGAYRPLTYLNVLPSERRVFRQRHVHVRTIAQFGLGKSVSTVTRRKTRRAMAYLLLQHRSILQSRDPLLAIAVPPVRQQQARQHSIDPHFASLCLRHALHEMKLRSFGHRVRHAGSGNGVTGYRACHDEDSTVRISVERGHGISD